MKNRKLNLFSSNRAQTEIKKGEEITAQYLTPLVGTMERRSKIRCTCLIFYLLNENYFHVKFAYFLSGRTGSFSAAVHAVQIPLSWEQISAAFAAASVR
jgi:hypothetical protein